MPGSDLACVCSDLREATRVVTRLYDKALAGYGLTVTQFAILRTVSRLGEPALSDVARAMVMDRTSLYRTLTPMIEHGWIAVAPARSGHAKRARLTPAGAERLAASEAGWRKVQDRFVGAFGEAEWATVSTALHKVLAVAGEAGDEA